MIMLNEPDGKRRILVVDDDGGQRSLLKSFLTAQGFDVSIAASGEEGLRALAESPPAMLISDVRMPGISGLELLQRAHEEAPNLPILLVTAYAQVRDAVGAIQSGAVDYLEKPIDLDGLLAAVRQSLGIAETGLAVSPEDPVLEDGVVAQSQSMRDVFREAKLVADSETRVLITGESGVGKEVVADAIHQWSPRAGGPLVKVNCAAIPEALLESELFGHERGSFTGATNMRVGRFEEAHGGTVLLDEIGETSLALQAKLLRVTQAGTFSRVGSNTERTTDARILAATNRNLEDDVAEGRFREDLFYRLNVIEIHVPPLRARQADIPELAHLFAQTFTKGNARFSPGAISSMESYPWPGNVRELRNAMERAVLLAKGNVILPEHLPRRVREAQSTPEPTVDDAPSGTRMEDIERNAILLALREHDFNRTDTARALGISRRSLTYKLRDYREQGFSVDEE
jgi:DNA-binding NtrC family response regulator